MRVGRIGYVGMRTDDVEAMTSFFRGVIGLEAAGEGETVTSSACPRIAAISSSCTAREHRDARLIPDDADLVISLEERAPGKGHWRTLAQPTVQGAWLPRR